MQEHTRNISENPGHAQETNRKYGHTSENVRNYKTCIRTYWEFEKNQRAYKTIQDIYRKIPEIYKTNNIKCIRDNRTYMQGMRKVGEND